MENQTTPQSYSNHARYVPMFHFVLFGMIVLTLVGSFVNLFKSVGTTNIYSASLITVIMFCMTILSWYARAFALRAQDRAIRAEENLRHFAMTGKLFDARLRMGQIVALRFASDEEFIALAKKAADENMKPDDIKKAVKNWRADYYRA
jgi:hypothetical protein